MAHQKIRLSISYKNAWLLLGWYHPCWQQWRKSVQKGPNSIHMLTCRVAHHWNQNFVSYTILRPKLDWNCHNGQQWPPVVPMLSTFRHYVEVLKRGNWIVRRYGWQLVSRRNSSVMTYCFLPWSLLTTVTNDHVQQARLSVIHWTLPCDVSFESEFIRLQKTTLQAAITSF